MNRKIQFHLSISSEDYLLYYQGVAKEVLVTSFDGRRVAFPASHLRPFVQHTGIHGNFEIEFDQDHKFVALRCID